MIKKKNFKTRLFKAFIIVGFFPLIIMTVFYYCNTSSLINKKINTSINENIKIMSSFIDSSINNFSSIVEFLAENKEIQQIFKKEKYSSYNEKFKDAQKIYTIITSVTANQKMDIPVYIMGLNNPLSRFTTQEYFSPIYGNKYNEIFDLIDSAEDNKLFYVHRRVDGRERKDIVLAICRQIIDRENDEKLGYVFLDIYDDYFNNILKHAKVYEGNNIYILDKQGYIITDKLYKDRTGFKFYENYVDTILNNKQGQFRCTLEGEQYVAYFNTLAHNEFKIVEIVPVKSIYKDKGMIVQTFIFVLILLSVFAIIVSLILSKSISKPINKLSGLMRRVEKGDMNVNVNIDSNDEIGDLGKSFNKMVREIDKLIEEVYIKQYLLKEAEYKNLKAQVNPHFLYNTLESIKWMAKLGENEGVVKMTTTLGKFLRYSISKKGDIVTVKEDIDQINNYLTIQSIRYGDKFSVDFEIDNKILDQRILKLLLQPLVENAIIHGLEPKLEKGKLVIKGYKKEENICFEIIDNGVGITNESTKGEGIGMSNVDKRVKIHYGEKYGVFLDRIDDKTYVKLILPYDWKGDEENDKSNDSR
ncbi:sensor histidine kinase [Clostridium ganghwense]|uniref:Sensor histidine kinase n=1 Tax=Clostridium ganghwense TaxID=312089 RepID=A0ABT4CPM7_9CLOT|nr:sensor histidine kinase [Clostridium ganghwense]MCY6370036.1 sensor histidine kinase [Clostridium ganghwense]